LAKEKDASLWILLILEQKENLIVFLHISANWLGMFNLADKALLFSDFEKASFFYISNSITFLERFY